MKRRGDAYLKFLSLVAESPNNRATLDPLEGRIADVVALAHYNNERLSVRELMARSELASPATLHGRLKSMHRKGWLLLAETDDSGRKQLELTPAALRHFAWLSDCVVRASTDSREAAKQASGLSYSKGEAREA